MAGFTCGNDKLSERLHKELPKAGPPEGKPMPKKNLKRPWKCIMRFAAGMGKGDRLWKTQGTCDWRGVYWNI